MQYLHTGRSQPKGWTCAAVLRGEGPGAMCYGRLEE
jgi:hypothetical protein